MYRKYRIVESIASSVSQYESYRDQVYRYTPTCNVFSHWLRIFWATGEKHGSDDMSLIQCESITVTIGERHQTCQTFPTARPKCLMGDMTNLYIEHIKPIRWGMMKVFRLHWSMRDWFTAALSQVENPRSAGHPSDQLRWITGDPMSPLGGPYIWCGQKIWGIPSDPFLA